MKKLLLILALAAVSAVSLVANPAYPGKIPYRQPDGSVVYVTAHGDEWFSYTTDEMGRCVKLGPDGYLKEAAMPTRAQLDAASASRNKAYGPAREWTPKTELTIGDHKVLAILVEFQDKQFTSADPRTDFYNLLNQKGYSYNGATGSVRDYYEENSGGLYRPVFDVYGPVKISGNVADYGGRTENGSINPACATGFFEAVKAVYNEGGIDFSDYDTDNDGYVDMILFYFAGYNMADGSNMYNTNTIWPHQSNLRGKVAEARTTRFNGKYVNRYFCTSEIQGYTGSVRCGIGTTCHEYGHSLGLPDFYDTDYEYNGSAGALYSFSLMCGGSRLNNENTPPYMNLEERRMLGWLAEEPAAITDKGEYSLSHLDARVLPTDTEGEYFLLESRSQTGWDRYIPYPGLLIYHVDKAAGHTVYFATSDRSYTAQKLWDEWEYSNAINASGTHPCFYLVPSALPSSLNYSSTYTKIPFPGAGSVSSYMPEDWDGGQGRLMLQNIKYSGSVSTFSVTPGAVPGVYGKVLNSSAKPVRNASVALYTASPKTLVGSCVTGIDGVFSLPVEDGEPGDYILETSCSGYISISENLSIARKMTEHNVYLFAEGESLSGDLQRYNPKASGGFMGYSDYPNSAVAMHFSADEMGLFQGKQLKSISFRTAESSDGTPQTGEFYVFVEVDGVRKFTQKVDNPDLSDVVTVNVVSQEFIIDTPGDTYIGYGIIGSSFTYAFLVYRSDEENMGYLSHDFSLTEACPWNSLYYSSSGAYYTPAISASLGTPVQPELGFNYIADPGNGVYAAGSRFDLELVLSDYDPAPSSVQWYFDGVPTSASSVNLSAGRHEIKAVLQLADGTNTLNLVIQAE